MALGLALEISRQEWLAIVLAIALVWVAEALNSALELLCDLVSPERHPTIKQVKDVAAAAVLMAALGSVVVAALVFGSRLLPYFYYLF